MGPIPGIVMSLRQVASPCTDLMIRRSNAAHLPRATCRAWRSGMITAVISASSMIRAPTFLSNNPPAPLGTIRPNVFRMPRMTARAKQRLCQHGAAAFDPDLPVPAGTHQMCQSLGVVGIGLVHLHIERLLAVTRIETDHRQAFSSERSPKPSGQWSRLETDAHRSRSIPTHCCNDRSSVSRASATPNPIARFIKHVKLRLFQRYIEPDILRHWLFSGCCVAITKLYPSLNKSSVIGSRDYRHVLWS